LTGEFLNLPAKEPGIEFPGSFVFFLVSKLGLGTVRLEAGVIWEVKVLLQEMPTPGS
jgi:hypothetical protein